MSVPFTSLQPVGGDDTHTYIQQAAQNLYLIVSGAATIPTANGSGGSIAANIQPLPGDVTNHNRLLYKRAALLYAIVTGQVTIPIS